METNIQIFNNDQFGQMRTSISTSNEPLFCLADVTKALGLDGGARNVKSRLKDRGVVTINTPTKNQHGAVVIQQMNYIDEPNLYRCIFQSRKKEAEQFQDWVVEEVLPSIRKSGGYMVAKPDETPEQLLSRALLVANDALNRTKERMEQAEKRALLLQSQNEAQADWIGRQDEMLESRSKHIRQMIPSVTFANAVKTSERSILIGELARIIKQNGVEIGQNRLFAWMRERGYLIKSTEAYNQPTQKAMNMGLFEIKKTVITKPNGTNLVTTTSKVTGKGQIYFVNKFLYEDANRQGAEFQKKLEAERKKGGAL